MEEFQRVFVQQPDGVDSAPVRACLDLSCQHLQSSTGSCFGQVLLRRARRLGVGPDRAHDLVQEALTARLAEVPRPPGLSDADLVSSLSKDPMAIWVMKLKDARRVHHRSLANRPIPTHFRQRTQSSLLSLFRRPTTRSMSAWDSVTHAPARALSPPRSASGEPLLEECAVESGEAPVHALDSQEHFHHRFCKDDLDVRVFEIWLLSQEDGRTFQGLLGVHNIPRRTAHRRIRRIAQRVRRERDGTTEDSRNDKVDRDAS